MITPSMPAALDRSQIGQPTGRSAGKLAGPAREFETLLLTQWLQKAESSFATVPGGDDGDSDNNNKDAGAEQFQNLGVQAIASALVDRGGIGIAALITNHLSAETRESEPAVTSPQDLLPQR